MKPKFKFSSSCTAPAAACMLIAALTFNASGDTFIWDTNPATTGAQDGNGVWTATSTNFFNITTNANAAPVRASTNTIQIGNTTGGSTVTINNGGALLNYSDSLSGSTQATTLNINRNYTIAGNAAGDGIAVGNIGIPAGMTVNISAQLTGGIGAGLATAAARNWNINASTLNLSGGGRLQNMFNPGAAPTIINITGTWLSGGLPASGTAATNIIIGGNGTTTQAAVLTVNQNAGSSATFAELKIGAGNNQNSGNISTYNLNGGTMAPASVAMGNATTAAGVSSKSILNVNAGTLTVSSELRLGNDGSGAAVNVTGGTATVNGLTTINRYGSTLAPVISSLNISGGVAKMGQIQLGRISETYLAGSSATVNVTGGSLYLSSATTTPPTNTSTSPPTGSSTSPNLTALFNLSGGVFGAAVNTSLAANINLIGTGSIIRPADEAGTPRIMTLSGNIGGTGQLRIGKGTAPATELGTVIVGGMASTYSGGTVLPMGILQTPATAPTAGFSSLGKGNLTITGSGTYAQFSNPQSVDDGAGITMNDGSLLWLDFSGTETVRSLTKTTLSGGNEVVVLSVPDGTYNADGLAAYGIAVIGDGLLKIQSGGYSSWATTNAGGQAANLDFDGDGVPNGVEYFFGATGSSFTANPSVVNGKITWPMSASATGVTYKVQTSTTLATGGWSDVSQASLVVTPGTPTGSVSYTLPTGLPKAFYRLVVTTP